MQDNKSNYFLIDNMYKDFSQFVAHILNSYIETKHDISFEHILKKMDYDLEFNTENPVICAIKKLDLTEFEQFVIIVLSTLEKNHTIHNAFFKFLKNEKDGIKKLFRMCVRNEYFDFSFTYSCLFTLDNGEIVFSDFFSYYLKCGHFKYVVSPSQNIDIIIFKEKANDVANIISKNPNILIYIYGDPKSGKLHFIKYIASKLNKKIFLVDFCEFRLCDGEKIFDTIDKALVFSKLEKGIVYMHSVPANMNDKEEHILHLFLQKLEKHIVFVGSYEKEALNNYKYKQFLRIKLNNLSSNEKIFAWNYFKEKYNAEFDYITFGNKYVFNIGEINNIFESANLLNENINEDTLFEAIKMRNYKLKGADLIETKFTFDDLVVEQSVKRQLDNIINQLKYKNVIYENWGFKDKLPYGNGISVLFYGASGTGKTMTASVIANELKLDLYRIDLSKLISKYIGETEKNISNLFDKAKNMNVVLFFDEADALFAKRSEVKDSNDKNSNAETAHLLQKLEEYDGIAILATNLFDQLDDAFRRRIKFVIPFVLPDVDVRKKLWDSILPPTEYLDDIDTMFFAKNFDLSGAQIKEIVLNASFLALAKNKKLSNAELKQGVIDNYQKYGKRLSNDDFLYLS